MGRWWVDGSVLGEAVGGLMDVFLDCMVLPCSMQAVCGSIRPHSYKHGIYEDVWCSAPRRLSHEAAIL